ncbi:unnamed protein product [Acanthoscelides obtectus]|uniref:Uncharacterized protein n=1 Tax=Acanthoscelides obtectus TaxID=200917 RepID=A0A9P0K696_ACAOB|nr:unnamed protein product [Acanthoscelides obtectus]CAK1658174.1 hypothetical protein AOBTE_LOCUS20746 [Acanthoscelides obtectus]
MKTFAFKIISLKFVEVTVCSRGDLFAGRNIVYNDETCIHSSHTVPKSWDDEINTSLQAPLVKGKRVRY